MRTAFVHRLQSGFSPILIDYRPFRKMQKRSDVPRMPVKIKVQPSALRSKALAQCDLEKLRKLTPKSTRKRRKSRLGATWAPFSDRNLRNFRNFRSLRMPRELRNLRIIRKFRNLRNLWDFPPRMILLEDPPGRIITRPRAIIR